MKALLATAGSFFVFGIWKGVRGFIMLVKILRGKKIKDFQLRLIYVFQPRIHEFIYLFI